MRIVVADYGVGNLHSIRKSLERNGASVTVTSDMEDLLGAGCIVFPGVGAFDRTMERLVPYRAGIRERLLSGVPALGICIGAQVLFGSSEEGTSEGIGVFDGRVVGITARQVPHMGWNTVDTEDPLMDGIKDRQFYFAHSYRCDARRGSDVVGTTEYEGTVFPSLFRTANVYGSQFHPEKSGPSGLEFVKNFIEFAEESI